MSVGFYSNNAESFAYINFEPCCSLLRSLVSETFFFALNKTFFFWGQGELPIEITFFILRSSICIVQLLYRLS